MSAALIERGLTAADIDRDPARATEANLLWLLEQLVTVHECEGCEIGGYDANLQSYYESYLLVCRNDAALAAVAAVARHNPAAWGPRAHARARALSTGSTEDLPVEYLNNGTSYVPRSDDTPSGEQLRAQIYLEALAKFAPISSSGAPAG
ncbi:MAG: hypothetical protein FJ304_27140 [Planctomycetes bacterium]|nr:hypothetical protein [Planctomycetota bacterium]